MSTVLRRVASLQRGSGFPHERQGESFGDLPFFKVGDFTLKGNERYLRVCENWVTWSTARELRAASVPSGSVLLPKIGAALLKNARRIATQQSVFDNNVLAVIPEGIDSCYLYYWLCSIDLGILANPGPVPSLDDSALLDQAIPVSNSQRQRAIADFLDAETARIDALIAKRQRQLRLLREHEVAVIDSLAVPSSLGGMADESSGLWSVVPLSRVTSFFTDGDWIESPYITDEGVRLIQTGNVQRGVYREQGFRYISTETFLALSCTEVYPGDVLISRLAGPVGCACIAPDLGTRMIASVDVVIARATGELRSEFLVAYLSSTRHLGFADLLARGTTMQRLSRSQVGQMSVPVPPLAIQDRIVEEMSRVRDRGARSTLLLEGQIRLLRERRQALITAAVTGELPIPGAAA